VSCPDGRGGGLVTAIILLGAEILDILYFIKR
jgi:hypothetical protein